MLKDKLVSPLDSRYSDKELREVYNSAQLIRSKHQSVGRDLTKRILEQTVNIFNDNIFKCLNPFFLNLSFFYLL